MTLEELQEFIKDENNKDAFFSMVKAMGFESQEDIEGLKKKNYELLGKLKDSKKSTEEIQKQLDNIDIDGYNNYITSNGQKPKGNDQEIKKLQRLLDEEQLKSKTIESNFNSMLKETAISKALDDAKIDSKHKSILTSAFLSKAKVEHDGDNSYVTIDDDGLGLPANEYMKKWAESELGQTYVEKPVNKGAGSGAFSGSGSKIKRSDFENMSHSEKAQVVKNVKEGSAQIID